MNMGTSIDGISRERRRWLTDDGVVLVGDEAGDPAAPTVVLLHGGGQTRFSWDSVLGALVEAGYHVLNYDARGHGESGWSADGVYSFQLRARDLMAICRSVEGPLALIGASMGGITAMQAVTNGMRPAAVVLVDIVARPDRAGVERIRDFMASRLDGFETLEEAVAAVAAYNPRRTRPPQASGLMRNLRQRSDGRLYWHWDPRIIPEDLATDLIAMERAMEGFARVSDMPTLLVRGADSDVVATANVAEFLQMLPHADVVEVAGAGHMVAGDNNDFFNAAILRYLSAHYPL